eukprot:SAG31_NODE_45060_length_260_cov_0.757764_1_plen_33_part_10
MNCGSREAHVIGKANFVVCVLRPEATPVDCTHT